MKMPEMAARRVRERSVFRATTRRPTCRSGIFASWSWRRIERRIARIARTRKISRFLFVKFVRSVVRLTLFRHFVRLGIEPLVEEFDHLPLFHGSVRGHGDDRVSHGHS